MAKTGIVVFFLMLGFIPVQQSVSDLHWGYDADNYRDMSNVNNILSGNLVQDPAYLDEYRWYNPLLHWIEAGIVRVGGIPVNEVLTKGGPYLNIFGPVCFFIMMLVLFNFQAAICATAGFIFFTAGDLPGFFSATYTPWLYPVTFVQFVFYLGIIAMYFAFRKPQVSSFALLGVITGVAFLGHTAPALILILQIAVLSAVLFYRMSKGKSELKPGYLLKCLLASGITFVLISLPFTWTVVGKYQLNMVNVTTWEYAEPMFQIRYMVDLVKSNLSVSMLIAVFGMIALAKMPIPALVKQILYSWLVISILLYAYVTVSKFIRFHYGITFPGIVPSFHFFFYVKAVQSVFFGFGFVKLFSMIIDFISDHGSGNKITASQFSFSVLLLISTIVVINYPDYLKRGDFNCAPVQKNDQYRADQIKVYQWLIANTGINEVVLCENDQIEFPLLPSGRKMVVCSIHQTNPYVDFFSRKADRDLMLAVLRGLVPEDQSLFAKYKVRYVLTTNSAIYPKLVKLFPELVFSSKTFSIHKITGRANLAGHLK